jgi:hypothetical protein
LQKEFIMDRSGFHPVDSVAHVWRDILELPSSALSALDELEDSGCYPSSFKVEHLAQCTIALSALSAALYWSTRHTYPVPKVTVPAEHACAEFKSERLYTLNGNPASSSWGTIGGLHQTSDGFVRIHDSFPNHRESALKILGLSENATREDVARKMLEWQSTDIEGAAFRNKAVIVALRSFEQWDALPQAKAVVDYPIILERIAQTEPYLAALPEAALDNKCLSGIRVVEM